jgi:hypothetical protein
MPLLLPGVAVLAVALGLVLEGSVLVLVPLVVLLELEVLPWADAPWPTLKSCHGTGNSLPSDVMTAKSIRPLVGFRTTSSMRPTSSPVLDFTCEPMIFEPRKCCWLPACPLPRPVALNMDALDGLD